MPALHLQISSLIPLCAGAGVCKWIQQRSTNQLLLFQQLSPAFMQPPWHGVPDPPPFSSAGTCLIQGLSCSQGVGGRCPLLLEQKDAQCKLGTDGRQREVTPQLPLLTGRHLCWCHRGLLHLRQVPESPKPILSERPVRKTHVALAQLCFWLGLGHGAMAALPHLSCWIWPRSLAV